MLPDEEIVLATILRAGIPFHQGFLNYFDDASCAFVSAYRRYSKDGTFNIRVEYVSAGDLTDKTLLLVDPMLPRGLRSCSPTRRSWSAREGRRNCTSPQG